MRAVFIHLIMTLFFSAQGFACDSDEVSLIIGGDQTTLCGGARADIESSQIISPDGFKITTFLSGSAAIARAESEQRNRLQAIKNEVKHLVFSIIGASGKEYGTAFTYKNYLITSLHVILLANEDKLFVFNATTNQTIPIVGYIPLAKPSPEKTISINEDLVIIDTGLKTNTTIETNRLNELDINQYFELSFPIIDRKLFDPGLSVGTIFRTTSEGLFYLNRSGQDRGSSGGPIFDFRTKEIFAVSICILSERNLVVGINLYDAVSNYEKNRESFSYFTNPPRDLFKIDYPGCPVIGGRGGGP
ncbi:MAG: hypothetical protein SGJ18_10275 [Pseudomonadota bacterium]|nr:hypothetical protein [Pseudomonadota bacterium]